MLQYTPGEESLPEAQPKLPCVVLAPCYLPCQGCICGKPLENTFKSPRGFFRCLGSNHPPTQSPIPLLTSISGAASGSYQQNRELQVSWATAEIPFSFQLSQGDLDTSCQLMDEWSSLHWSWRKVSNRLESHNCCHDSPSHCCGH